MRPLRAAAATACIIAALLWVQTPALAGEHDPPRPFGLPENLEDLLDPEALDGMMEDLMREFGPAIERALEGVREALGDLDAYLPPEMLPNGDIIIRRREPLGGRGVPSPPDPGETGPADGPIWL